MKAAIKGISYYLPEQILGNEMLAVDFPEWSATQIQEKTGIKTRHIASKNETSSDLATAAAKKLFSQKVCLPEEIEMVIFCTQSPDYFLPTSACLIQSRLGIPTSSAAFDFNLGCSGYIYGLSMAKAYIESGIVKNVLFLTGETYSKFYDQKDKSVRTIFGDAGTATFIQGIDAADDQIGPFIFGTDGSGGKELIVPIGGTRYPNDSVFDEFSDSKREDGIPNRALYMNGPNIFSFTLKVVPKMINGLYQKADTKIEDIDLFVFHQANKFMLENLRRQSRIPETKFVIDLENVGNTVCNSIPLALARAQENSTYPDAHNLMLVGFGVGLSWGACLVKKNW
jgi:3-oxoacyl-[acyl-carrier-protein] synthase-3